jgi:hypothetical protein
MTALRELLTGIVDYAGLFPPAGLPMGEAVNNFARYVKSEHAWMLGRFVVQSAKLDEFELAAKELLPKKAQSQPWRLSVLMPAVDSPDDAFMTALQRVNQFNHTHQASPNGFAFIDSTEIKAGSADQVDEIAKYEFPEASECFVEIDPGEDPQPFISRLKQHVDLGLRAKVRTGGIESGMIPKTSDVARFIARCAQNKVAFKATAGLHHPLRSEYPLTYKPDADRATMHGFLNVFLAACVAWQTGGDDASVLADILDVDSKNSIRVGESAIGILDRSVDSDTIISVRSSFARSFGSCSFVEPVDDLNTLGILPARNLVG